jgi:excisionase family DNA binding protein
MEERRAYKTTEAAKLYGISRETVLRRARNGILKGHKGPRDWLFPVEELERVFLGKETVPA